MLSYFIILIEYDWILAKGCCVLHINLKVTLEISNHYIDMWNQLKLIIDIRHYCECLLQWW